jgi:glycosyltransferase involved in cell wall biosynthesis
MTHLNEKLALFLPNLEEGGAERAMVNLARGFVEEGFEVDLILAKAEGPYLIEVPNKVRVVDLGARRVLYSLPNLVRYLSREKPAVMLSMLENANLIALWAKKLAGVTTRVIVSVQINLSHNANSPHSYHERFIPHLVRLFYPWADKIVACSNGVAEDLLQLTGLGMDKVMVIYNPIVTPELYDKAEEPLDHPWFVLGSPRVILGAGRLTEQKDFPTLIRAFALVHNDRPIRLMILGEGEERRELESLVRNLGLEADVELPGFVMNPFKYMKRATVFVLSSKYEGFPFVLGEAVACGTTVIATNCPSGPAEILKGGRFGRLVPVGDVQALAAAITNAINERKHPDVSALVQEFSLYTIVQEYLKAMNIAAGDA